MRWNGLLPLLKMLLVALAIGTLPITVPMLAEALTDEEPAPPSFNPIYRADEAHGLCFATLEGIKGVLHPGIYAFTLVPNIHCKEFQ